MGNYNPNLPFILGQEWVPIRDEDLTFSPVSNAYEIGTTFTPTTLRTLQDGRFYVKSVPPAGFSYRTMTISIYPVGKEDESGPIKRVLIPVNNGGVTGLVPFFNATTVAEALWSPSGERYMSATPGSGARIDITMFFPISSYAPQLLNKRIVGVNLIYACATLPDAFTGNLFTGGIYLTNDSLSEQTFYCFVTGESQSSVTSALQECHFGEVNVFDTGSAPQNAGDRTPWTYSSLSRLEASSANRRMVRMSWPPFSGNGGFYYLFYAALEVLYCEEQRVAIGMTSFGAGGADAELVVGANRCTMRTVAGATLPQLSSGQEYVVTLAGADIGDIGGGAISLLNTLQYPTLNSDLELYQISPHRSKVVNLTTTEGDVFTEDTTHQVPQLTLATSATPLPEVHVYGRQAAAPAYGTVTVQQNVLDAGVGGAASFPWVRYYARRWGDTTVPLLLDSPSIAGSSVSISVSDFDALDEILDGWKEVTLRFATPPSMGAGTNPTWRWSATGENVGNRWEILGANAPALSGLPGNMLNLAPTPTGPLGSATYGEPSAGTTIAMTWLSPSVTAAALDSTSDAVLIFGQDPPAITGLAVSQLTQSVTGLGLDCGGQPCCVPTGIFYNRITWSLPPATTILLDTFTRAATGWGNPDSGQAYTDVGGTVEGNYITTGTEGTHVLDGAANVSRSSVISGSFTDSHQQITASINTGPTGASMRSGLIGHRVDANNFDIVDFRWATNGNLELVIAAVVGGTQTGITNVSVGPFIAGQEWYLVADYSGNQIRAKAWPVGTPEPEAYQAQATATFTVGGYGVRSIRSTGNTDATAVISYDNYSVGPSTSTLTGYELQRMDPITDWQTIMLTSGPALTGFNDYEARPGLLSSYRIRSVDLYGFYSDWSATASITMASPGVTGGSCVTSGHILIFTSNEMQSGAANLAHSAIWDQNQVVSEDFSFPEASWNTLQAMYNKNFYTGFRPTERGGSVFTRTLLIQGAAISVETLPDFTSLRDMAWDQLSYVCVRDEDGNRWFANVVVPTGQVQRDRTLYMAPVTITEVTDTSTQVDPVA